MATEDLLGTAIIELRASFDKLKRDLDKAKAITDRLPDGEVKVNAATDKAKADLAAVTKQVQGLPDGDAKVTADTGTAMADVRGLDQALAGVKDENVTVALNTGDALPEVRGLDKALDGIEDETVKVNVDTSGARGELSSLKTSLAGVAGGLGGAGLLDLAKSDAQLDYLSAKVDTVFGKMSGAVRAWADANNEAAGLTETQFAGMAASIGDLLIPMGMSREAAAAMSMSIAGLAPALAAWEGKGRSAAEVGEILTGALLGETDALQSLGIAISAADVQARLASKGQAELTGNALKQAEALAIQELLMEKTTDAQTAWNSPMADSIKKQGELDAAMASLGEKLGSVVGFFNGLPGPLQLVIVGFGALVALGLTLAPVFSAFAAASAASAVSTAAAGASAGAASIGFGALSLSILPIVAVILAVIAVVALLIIHWDTLTEHARKTWDFITEKVGQTGDFVERRVGDFVGFVVTKWDWLRDKGGQAVDWIRDKWEGLVGFITGTPERIGSALAGVFDSVIGGFRGAWNAVASVVNRADFTMPAGIPFVGGRTIGLPDLPMLAEGGSITRSGFALVGERGPEVRWLNKGDAISPIGDGGPAGRGGGPAPVINVFVGGHVTSSRDLVYAIADGLDEIGWRRR